MRTVTARCRSLGHPTISAARFSLGCGSRLRRVRCDLRQRAARGRNGVGTGGIFGDVPRWGTILRRSIDEGIWRSKINLEALSRTCRIRTSLSTKSFEIARMRLDFCWRSVPRGHMDQVRRRPGGGVLLHAGRVCGKDASLAPG